MLRQQKRNPIAVIIFILVCVLLSQGLHLLSRNMQWPIWLDLTGVALAAAVGGPLVGVITAALNNISLCVFFYGITSLYYVAVTATLALIVGFAVLPQVKFDI